MLGKMKNHQRVATVIIRGSLPPLYPIHLVCETNFHYKIVQQDMMNPYLQSSAQHI